MRAARAEEVEALRAIERARERGAALGFILLLLDAYRPGLRAVRAEERRHGFDGAPRIVMRKRLKGAASSGAAR